MRAVGYDPTSSDVQSQITRLEASGANTLCVFASGKFAIQAFVHADKLGWHPRIYVSDVASASSLMRLDPQDTADGAISILWAKDPTTPLFAGDAGVRLAQRIVKAYLPGGSTSDSFVVAGMAAAYSLVDALQAAGRNLTRQGLMTAATNMDETTNPFLAPGITCGRRRRRDSRSPGCGCNGGTRVTGCPSAPFVSCTPREGGRAAPAEVSVLVRRSATLIALVFLLAPAAARAAVNPQIAGLQVALRAHGLYLGPIDGVAGPRTAAAVHAFQRKVGLPVGVATRRTRLALGPLGRPLFGARTIKAGDFGWDVAVLQFLLTRDGVYTGALDGYFGKETAAGVTSLPEASAADRRRGRRAAHARGDRQPRRGARCARTRPSRRRSTSSSPGTPSRRSRPASGRPSPRSPRRIISIRRSRS